MMAPEEMITEMAPEMMAPEMMTPEMMAPEGMITEGIMPEGIMPEGRTYLENLYILTRLRYELAAARLDGEGAREAEERVLEFLDGLYGGSGRKQEEEEKQERRRDEGEDEGEDEDGQPPLLQLFVKYRMTAFERHVVMMLLFWELEEGAARANADLCGGRGEVTLRLLKLTWEGEPDTGKMYMSLNEGSLLREVFLEEGHERGMDGPLYLKKSVMSFILGGRADGAADPRLAEEGRVDMEGSPVPGARRMKSPFRLSDVVLPEFSAQQLQAAARRVKNAGVVYREWGLGSIVPYGRGVSLLFFGPPGTGKTMAAGALANELDMELFRINLPAVVSKYVGETERNIEKIFESARGRRVVLFFDEADVLFGKRTDIKEANDRYGNMEAAFLLQRIEEYEGVSVLATNLRRNFDEAFSRRLTALVDFPFPDETAREEIWRRSVPEKLMGEGLNLKEIAARFELSGSSIKNSVLYAAFLAADRGGDKLTKELVLEGVRQEYLKQGKTLSREEMGLTAG